MGNAGQNKMEVRKPRPLDLVALIAVGLVSLVLTTTVNYAAGQFLYATLPRFDWIADAAIPSCVACVLVYLACAPSRPFAMPNRDRGLELASHANFSIATDVAVFFCDPRSPWQRGSNENTNGLLRQYFPDGRIFPGLVNGI